MTVALVGVAVVAACAVCVHIFYMLSVAFRGPRGTSPVKGGHTKLKFYCKAVLKTCYVFQFARRYITIPPPFRPPGRRGRSQFFFVRSWRVSLFGTLSAEMHRVRVRLLRFGTLRAEMHRI